MLNTYDVVSLKQKLNMKSPIETERAVYTLLRMVEELQDKVAELEKRLDSVENK